MSAVRVSTPWLVRCSDAERLARATILIWTGPQRQLRSPASRVLLRPGWLRHVRSVGHEAWEEAREHSTLRRRPRDVALEEEVEEEWRAFPASYLARSSWGKPRAIRYDTLEHTRRLRAAATRREKERCDGGGGAPRRAARAPSSSSRFVSLSSLASSQLRWAKCV